MKKEIYGAAKNSHMIYTIEGGLDKHDFNQQMKGALKLAAIVTIGSLVGKGTAKITTLIKNNKLKKRK